VRTSRILASLMAAAQEQRNNTRAAKLVINLAPGISNMVQAAAGVAQARSQQPFAGAYCLV
jgi:L-2-hydroxyglutarate oxidase LhgO